MIDMRCLCGNESDLVVVYEQNLSEQILSPLNFSARGKHDIDQEHLHYRIVRCRKCSQLFSNPILPLETIEHFYSKSVHDYSDEIENIAGSYLKPLRKVLPRLTPGSSILEVGCGSGFILETLMERGFQQVVGIEPSVQAVAGASPRIRPHIRNCLFERTSFAESSVDLICAFQVLDHFVRPDQVIRDFMGILRPGGMCYAIIHNEQALHVKVLGEKSPIIDVSHIYFFNPRTLRKLFEDAGFQVIDQFNIWNRYTLRTWLRMLPIPFKSGVLRVLEKAGLADLSVSIPAGNIGIIAQKRSGSVEEEG